VKRAYEFAQKENLSRGRGESDEEKGKSAQQHYYLRVRYKIDIIAESQSVRKRSYDALLSPELSGRSVF
jgi:hypothetical protein